MASVATRNRMQAPMSVTGAEPNSDTALADASWQALVLHDLRTPLTVVHLQTQVLHRLASGGVPVADQPPDLTRGLDRIERAVTQMVGMLDCSATWSATRSSTARAAATST